ncbi:hypothetical protein ANN_13583 [Periplaneta americana]|uniref:Uncharacterized protein n=1 Tax=Periplaneta americana TaxID=6978 RepID=A0ABQ8TM06_PERAM|nr:hypothetical protein ANN_13583 [Periplaneta americana]
MAGLREGGNEPSGSLKAICNERNAEAWLLKSGHVRYGVAAGWLPCLAGSTLLTLRHYLSGSRRVDAAPTRG